jgi:hypothetical protein
MLKISLVEGRTRCFLVLEGKLVGPWATELKIACEKARADFRDHQLVVEMKHITTISQEGENVVVHLLNEGVKFRCHDVFTKHVLKQLARRARKL